MFNNLSTLLDRSYKLKNMKRYNNAMTIKEESVAEHSFYVALFTLYLGLDKGLSDEDLLKDLIVALCHDLPEIDISDIPHNIKYNNKELEKLCSQEEAKWYISNMPIDLISKTNSFEMSDIVKAADNLSVIQYSENEVKLGNSYFKNILEDAKHRFKLNIDYKEK